MKKNRTRPRRRILGFSRCSECGEKDEDARAEVFLAFEVTNGKTDIVTYWAPVRAKETTIID